MSAKRVSVNQKRDQKNKPQAAIEAVGTEALFNPEPTKAETKSIGAVEAKSPSNKPESSSAAKSKEQAEEAEQKEDLVKTTAYIEESKYLALEDIQLKLKRQEKRRVTKNELFNKAIELLIEHYQ